MSVRKRHPDRARRAAAARARRQAEARDPWDFPTTLPTAPVDVLAEIMPLPPDWTRRRGQLTSSPARTWLDLPENLPDDGETRELVARWPFRIAHQGEPGGKPFACLALLAYQCQASIEQTARALCEQEEAGLVVWSGEHNVYVMSAELDGVRRSDDPESLAAADAVLERLATENTAGRATRRWTAGHAQVVAEEIGGDER